MSDSPDLRGDEDLIARLRSLGQRPVDPALQSAHLTSMAGVESGSVFARSFAGRLKVAAGVLAGFLLGASGLTTVGAMGPLQPIAATAVEAVAPIDVPKGAKDKAEEAKEKAEKASRLADGSIGTQRIWDDGCVAGEDGKFAGNRGLYLKQERAKGAEALAAAKASDCGKPVADEADEDDATKPETESEKPEATETDKPEAQNDGAGKSDEEHGKTTAPGQTKDKSGDDEGGKPESPGRSADKGGQPDSAGKSGIAPSDPETPAEPTTPVPETEHEAPADQA
jgi:hypothetical protein